jgi:hypothetical protein
MASLVAYSALPRAKASRWKAILLAARIETITTTLRLRQFRPVMISRAMTAASASRNAASMAAAGSHPIRPENVTARRPAIQISTSATSGPPWIGSRPVQLGTAVSRNPVITAAA